VHPDVEDVDFDPIAAVLLVDPFPPAADGPVHAVQEGIPVAGEGGPQVPALGIPVRVQRDPGVRGDVLAQ